MVKETLTTAAAKLDDKEKDTFTEALRALRAPREQRVWLRDVATMQTLPESEKILDFSAILICHPDTGEAIDYSWYKGLPEVAKFLSSSVNFSSSVFVYRADFTDLIFELKVDFAGATFVGQQDDVNFNNTTFKDTACFIGTNFLGNANFIKTKFEDVAQFNNAVFNKNADFEAVFNQDALFNNVQFTRKTNFAGTEFIGKVSFETAHFKQVATFHAARFAKTVSFQDSEWGAVPDFIGTAWKDGVAIADFHQLQTNLNNGTLDWRTPSTSALIADRLQALRKMARDADDRPRELDYFALELKARYQGKGLGAGLKRCLVGLYGWFSNYGRGIGRPFVWLAGLCLLSMVCYWVLADGDGRVLSKDRLFALTYGVLPDVNWRVWDNALLLSLVNALPPLGASSTARESSLKALYGCDIPTAVHFIAVGEGILGLILLFLIALGLRNRFRL
ncbi:MAG: pentapeptide repeat-containing protein [Alphaproteobacteria bacterium]